MKRAVVLALVLAVTLQSTAAHSASPRKPSFAYDRTRPLALRLEAEESAGGVVRRAFTFDAGGVRRPGFWTRPEGTGPWPVALFSPGSDGDASSQLPDADRLALRGIASLTVSPPAPLLTCRAAADVKAYVRYVVGRRRALDLLRSLPGADTDRVAAVGFSFGAAVTATLAGVDHRLRGAVLQSGRAHLSAPLGAFCDHLGPAGRRTYVGAFAAVDPVLYVGRAVTASLLFQNGRRDPISPASDVRAFVKAARQPKTLRWYNAGHELNEKARADRDAWLVRLLTP